MSALQFGKNSLVEDRLTEAVRQEVEKFKGDNPKSFAQYEKACQTLPGGSTRSTVFYAPFPLTIEKGEGIYLYDIDGHRYRDFVGEFTVGLYGHDPVLLDKILNEIRRMGTMLSGPTEYEEKLANLICSRFPSCDLVRFCNSGTEANLLALGMARNVTGKDGVLVFKGAYHGGVLTFGDVDGAMNVPIKTIKATYNALSETRDLIDKNAANLGVILLEPMMGAGGCIAADRDFLQMLRDKASEHGIVLIFDEVMTSRLAPGGLQGEYQVVPDLTTFGKYMGGGFSFGAFGGKRELMSRLDGRAPNCLPHSGTFNNNIASMVGGYIGLSQNYTPDANVALNTRGDLLRQSLNSLAQKHKIPLQVIGKGAVMTVHFTAREIKNPTDTHNPHGELLRKLLHLSFLNKGFYIAHRCLITLNLMMRDDDIRQFCTVFETFLESHKEILTNV